MNYNSIHGPGISNFSSPSNHRMPTVSAAQALDNLKFSPTRCISTGIDLLDAYLQNKDPSDKEFVYGGISRGQVTEIHGPPGVGKTAFALQLAASVLHAGEGVIWIDASQKIPGPRLAHILTSLKALHVQSSQPSLESLLSRYTHFSTPTLAHLIALLSYSSLNPFLNKSLMVIDSLSTLTTAEFSGDQASNPSARRLPILQRLISTLQKIAARQNIAVFITLQCLTKIRLESGAILVPAINTNVWEQGLRCRLVLFRDWGWRDEDGEWIHGFRIVKIIKAEGVTIPEATEKLVGIRIVESGLVHLPLPTLFTPSTLPPSNPGSNSVLSLTLKRKVPWINSRNTESDENDEDYGWNEEDEQDLHLPPSHWQGKEEALVEVGTGEENVNKRSKALDFGTEDSGEIKFDESHERVGRKLEVIENSESEDELAF